MRNVFQQLSAGFARILFVQTLTVMLLAPPSHISAQGRDRQKSIRTFTNRDLEKYPAIPVQPPEPFEYTSDSVSSNDAQFRRTLSSGEIFRENSPAVVPVIVYDRKGRLMRYGSGFAISGNGLIVTSFHVVRNASSLKVLVGKKLYPVQGLVSMDKEHDFAVLKADVPDLPAVRFGSVQDVMNGDPVFVMSNPGGEEVVLTEGVVKGIIKFGRKKRMFQVTAAFSEGSSGGPVLNARGEVIGIATSGIETEEKLNFVVPSDIIQEKLASGEISEQSETFLGRDRRSADYWMNIAQIALKSGRLSEAAGAYQKAVERDGKMASAYNGLGVVFMELKQYHEAENAFKKALSIDPDLSWVHSNLGLMYSRTGRYEEAISVLTEAVRISPELETPYLNLGNAYRWARKYHEARDAYKQAVTINPSSAYAHYSLGLTYRDLDDIDSAREEFRILQELDPELAKELDRWID